MAAVEHFLESYVIDDQLDIASSNPPPYLRRRFAAARANLRDRELTAAVELEELEQRPAPAPASGAAQRRPSV